MASRTRIVCLHEGKAGRSIDPIFIRSLLKALDPAWIRPWNGNNVVRPVDCGGRPELIARTPSELRACLSVGSDTTLIVWADLDHDMTSGDDLKREFWSAAQSAGITEAEFAQIVFVFAKDRLENWIEFLLTNGTDENKEGPRQKDGSKVVAAARRLAERCKTGAQSPPLPPSLAWSCRNWRQLVQRIG